MKPQVSVIECGSVTDDIVDSAIALRGCRSDISFGKFEVVKDRQQQDVWMERTTE
jgi:hypothetical protein